MREVLIVDDDTIIRITLRSMVDWESLGYHIAADAVNGSAALSCLQESPVDLVITDMKMPVLDGIGLMKALNRWEHVPKVLVLSGYDDFKLVREAFRLGAYDYLLKSDLQEELLSGMLLKLNQEMEAEDASEVQDAANGRHDGGLSAPGNAGMPKPPLNARQSPYETRDRLVAMAMGKRKIEPEFFPDEYLVMQFEIQDFKSNSLRFGERIEDELVRPMLELAVQIPRVAARCVLGSISPSRYVMLYRISDGNQYEENARSACRQLCSVWNQYMNLFVSAGISTKAAAPAEFLEKFEEAGNYLKLTVLNGHASIGCPWEKKILDYGKVCRTGEMYEELLKGLLIGDEFAVAEEKQKLFAEFYQEDIEEAKTTSLALICQLAWRFLDNHDDIRGLFTEETNYYDKIGRLDEIPGLKLWLNNYFRWVIDYEKHRQDRKQEDLMSRARRFILDNFSNPELTLKSVAGYVGLNEKYFTTRFTKEEGMTFSNFLTGVRMKKAMELMEQTDLKIYEISQSVGYNSTEHFTRVFKKLCGVSPGNYRKE